MPFNKERLLHTALHLTFLSPLTLYSTLHSKAEDAMQSIKPEYSFRGAQFNSVERCFLEQSQRKVQYPGERLPIIETDTVQNLGKLTALSFIQWLFQNPQGVISLPTGKTPEYFIKYLRLYKKHWKEPSVQKELQSYGIYEANFPNCSQIKFVQMDEFFPLPSTHPRLFKTYIQTQYLEVLEIPKEHALLMDLSPWVTEENFPEGKADLSLLKRKAESISEEKQKKALLEVQEFCENYEKKIQDLGGISFFLGGIGPEGHLAFNMSPCNFSLGTHLTKFNYPSAAAAAIDLGGIEQARKQTAVSIGLNTLRFSKNLTAILMAAGEGKARVIAKLVQNKQEESLPASYLQSLPQARVYLNKGASSLLPARIAEDVLHEPKLSTCARILMDFALEKKKTLKSLRKEELEKNIKAKAAMQCLAHQNIDLADFLETWTKNLKLAIEQSSQLPQKQHILHSSPHHDDIMLSYHPLVSSLLQENENHFVYLTSGFNSVSDGIMMQVLSQAHDHFIHTHKQNIFHKTYQEVLDSFREAFIHQEHDKIRFLEVISFLHQAKDLYEIKTERELCMKTQQLLSYFKSKDKGMKDPQDIEILKGALREAEADRMWALDKIQQNKVKHLRCRFYTSELFDPKLSREKDALPLQKLYEETKVNLLTLALDPVSTGPSTHYKVLQVLAEALRLHPQKKNLRIWGYRNVWWKFHPYEANRIFPLSKQSMEKMHQTFLGCFHSQKNASFPSPDYDGPFSSWCIQGQREQKDMLYTLLGEQYFSTHPREEIRRAEGFLFLKEMSCEEFLQEAENLEDTLLS